jgi:phage-related protein
LPSFTWTPDFGATKSSKPTIIGVKFGDGYEARYAQGINTNPRSWSLRFTNRSVSEADAIEAFLIARGGVESFDFTGTRADETVRVVCKEWTRSTDHATLDSLSATFTEVFEP